MSDTAHNAAMAKIFTAAHIDVDLGDRSECLLANIGEEPTREAKARRIADTAYDLALRLLPKDEEIE